MQGTRYFSINREKMRVQEFKVNVEGHEATVTAKSSGWLWKKEKVEYDMSQIPRGLLRPFIVCLQHTFMEN